MAHLYIKEILAVFVSWIVYGKIKNYVEQRRLRKWGEENGCGEPPMVPNELPYGVERAWRMLTGMKGIFSNHFQPFICFISILPE